MGQDEPLPGASKENILQKDEIKTVGGIKVFSNPTTEKQAEEKAEDKKAKRTAYMPSGTHMKGFVLTGLDAKTIQSAKGNPQPFLIRIQDLAVLPNDIKEDLSGCVVVAHGWGTLDDERIQAQLVHLACMARNAQAVIDQQVMGYVADGTDGKNGIRGEVVTKMGALALRAFIAGALGGAGDAVRRSSGSLNISPLGQTQSFDPNRIGQGALGGGLAGASDELKKVFVELMRQTMPIIQMGATQEVTVVIEKGVLLEIKDYCIGRKKCES
ncbi:MAG: TraB/VirB10 family protein [Candidatus Manganitrophaceae bacterium]